MRRLHFETLRPLCPQCLRDKAEAHHLECATVLREEADTVIEGVLTCPSPACRAEYPIIDGIPVIVADLRAFLTQNALALLCRDDLTPATQSLLGDCFGPGSAYDSSRHYLSAYAHDHYGDLAPASQDAPPDGARTGHAPPGSMLRLLAAGLDAAGTPAPGPVLDAGCSVGRSSFALAERLGTPVLGVDLNLDMLRFAQRVLLRGVVRHPLRRVGLVYDARDVPASFAAAPLVDFWAMDATQLPLPDATFALATSCNLLDCVASPCDHLRALGRVLAPGAAAVVATPFDWSGGATPVEAWLGGHSQRGPGAGDSARMLRGLFAPHGLLAADGLSLEREVADQPWAVRLHDRAVMHYLAHIAVVRKAAAHG
ncbi:MAG: methyltransferase domain-containing protein [Desulfovibrionaceae bacterium]